MKKYYAVFTNTMPGFNSVGMIVSRNFRGFQNFRTSREAFAAAHRRNYCLDEDDKNCQCVAKRIGGRWIVVHQLPVVYVG